MPLVNQQPHGSKKQELQGSAAAKQPQLLLIQPDETAAVCKTIRTDADSRVVCQCMLLDQGALHDTLRDDCFNLKTLMEKTGAGTACGGCQEDLRYLLGREDWTPMCIARVKVLNESVRSITFVPSEAGREFSALETARPGQHVIVQAWIDGQWIQRPYTLSAPTRGSCEREITVRRKDQGQLSGWLFDQGSQSGLFRISRPQGQFCAELGSRPLVFLTAGIGVTPALVTLRTLVSKASDTPFYLDYSEHSADRFICEREFKDTAANHRNVQINLRTTSREGYLGAAEILAMSKQWPGACYFVCGPPDYEQAVIKHLNASGVASGQVRVESFNPASNSEERTEEDQKQANAINPRRSYAVLGALLVGAFIAQDLLNWNWPWLEAMQSQESYKLVSGSLLGLLLTMQWVMPVLRLRGNLRAATIFYPWHKWLGVLAPLFLYAHSTHLGYAFTLLLSSVFLANIVLGFLNKEIVSFSSPQRQQTFNYYWLIAHVVLSILTIGLMFHHTVTVFNYE